MSSCSQIWPVGGGQLEIPQCQAEPQWYAVHTRSQHEKSVASHLQKRGITTFLPLVSEVHRWSDRRKIVQLPLFACYIFVDMVFVPELRAKVVQVNGVLRFVGVQGEGTPIPASEIEGIRAILANHVPYQLCPFLKVGQRVRIRGGILEGIEGTLVARNGDRYLIISVEPIQRSLSISIRDYQVVPV